MAIDLANDPYVLEGRVVTMSSAGVIEHGAIYIHRGIIQAVQSVEQAAPAGFSKARRIRTGDTLYPGMIELHNHLSYNVLPLWDVPRKFSNNSQWRRRDEYRADITKPMQVLAATPGIPEALIRYVEVRSLLGGVTTSQGITLSSHRGIPAYYEGLVRNVERPLQQGLEAAGTSIANPKKDQARRYLDKLETHSCYLQHLSEGVDDVARGWFQNLQISPGQWALNEAFCGIHGTALKQQDFEIIARHGGSMVWSPLSNYLLYGETVHLPWAQQAGILMGLGCDWSPSGSKNLLGELKVAWLASEAQGSVFSPQQLVAMVTSNPARIARWHKKLGSIEAGKYADLIAINGQSGDDYLRLIQARETGLTLVMINGIPRLGQPRLMSGFGVGSETIKIGRSERVLNLDQAAAHPLVNGLSLAQARQRLQTAMADLPRLARNLNANKSVLADASVQGSSEQSLNILFEFEADDKLMEPDLGALVKPITYYVTRGMELEPITVADGKTYFTKLAKARNLPEFIKKGLPAMYGETMALPESAKFLENYKDELAPEVVQTTRLLSDLIASSGLLTLEDRRRIVEQAMILLGENYVHLPFKRAMHAVDPLQRLRLLKYQLNEAVEGELPPEMDFHNELSDIFNSLRDLHTNYRLPEPYLGNVAWLPFLLEEITEAGRSRFIVSQRVGEAGPESFRAGVEVTHWNGMPIHEKIKNNADQHAGSNAAARWARGINTLTIKPLGSGFPPQEEWVTITYLDQDGKRQHWTQEWFLFDPIINFSAGGLAQLLQRTALGVDDTTDAVQQARKILFAPKVHQAQQDGLTDMAVARSLMRSEAEVPTQMPGVFLAKSVKHKGKAYAYIRIFTFSVRDADAFVAEFVRLSQALPDSGMVIDVRGNGGGLIFAAEQLLQVLTPRHIEPEKTQFINSPLNLALCRNHANSTLLEGLVLEPWVESMKQAVQTGAAFSHGFAITPEEKCNELGQRYFGPVVLVVDPLCYSATDIFAAGFRDHDIGPIVGTGANTGAGGANVWTHELLMELAKPHQFAQIVSPYKALPQKAQLRVSIRRTLRVGDNEGAILEDMGVIPDTLHAMTRDDVLNDNKDLIATAIETIAAQGKYKLSHHLEQRENALPILKLSSENIDRIDITIGSLQLRSRYPVEGKTQIDLEQELADREQQNMDMELRAYKASRLVARSRIKLELSLA